MSIKLILASRNTERPGSSYLESSTNILHIDCRGCDRYTDCCSPECISCMCEAVAANGTADKIRLESGKDMEISGRAAELICSLARIRRPIVRMPAGVKCGRCKRNPDAIMEHAWAEFPEPDFASARARLYSDRHDRPECASCMQRTQNALASSEREMEQIRKNAESVVKIKEALL